MLWVCILKAMIGVLPNAPLMGGSEGSSGAVSGNAYPCEGALMAKGLQSNSLRKTEKDRQRRSFS